MPENNPASFGNAKAPKACAQENATSLVDDCLKTPRACDTTKNRTSLFLCEIISGTIAGIFLLLALTASVHAQFAWDVPLALTIQSISLPGFDPIMRGVTALGNSWVPFAVAGFIMAVLFSIGLRLEAIVGSAGIASASLSNVIIKTIIDRPRPDGSLVHVFKNLSSESFPSGHTVFFVVCFGYLLFLSFSLTRTGPVWWVVRILLVMLIAIVGVSRVYLGAHWPSDVVGGYLAGSLWLIMLTMVYRRFRRNV